MTNMWKTYTLADAYKPRPPVEYVVGGLLPLPSLSIVYGAPGTLKTMLLIDMAIAVAGGVEWLPSLPGNPGSKTGKKTLMANVLWVDCDNGLRVMHERVGAIGEARKLLPPIPFHYVSMPTPWLDASSKVGMIALDETAQILGARLIILDNLRNISGKADENSAEMGTVLSNLHKLAELTGAAVCIIHHQRKPSGAKGRAGDTLRGHSSIEASLDLALLITREEDSDTIELKATKVRGAEVPPFGAMFTYNHRPGTQELAQAQFFGLKVEDLSSNAAIRRVILEIVAADPGIKQGDLVSIANVDLPKVGRPRIKTQLNKLIKEGKLTVVMGAKNAKHHSIPKVAPLDAAMTP